MKISYTLRKYDYAMYLLNLEVRRGLEKVDEVLRDIPSTPTSHGGTIRQVSGPKIVETPMRKFGANVTVEGEWVRRTDVDVFTGIIWEYCQEIISQLTRCLFEMAGKITDATGNVTDAKGKNVWDAQIEAMKRQEMRFDREGNHGYKFYAHPSSAEKFGSPTPEQVRELDLVIKKKREEHNAKKRTRRLS
jgi:hypothetical protein